MENNRKFQFFCTQFLLQKYCNRGAACIFIHANIEDVDLLCALTLRDEFVKGYITLGCHVKGRTRRFQNRNTRMKYTCYYKSLGLICPYGIFCTFKPCGTNYKIQKGKSSVSESSSNSGFREATNLPNSYTGSKKKLKTNFKPLPHLEKKNKVNELEMTKKLRTNTPIDIEKWVNAPEFIPKYSQNVSPNDLVCFSQLCPYAERDGNCKYPPGECTYLHGKICEFCGRAALHPYNEMQRKQHMEQCGKQHENDKELLDTISRSKEKMCGICFEIIMQKSSVEQRFGILSNCNHCFCYPCIRKWRQTKYFDNKLIRACPECRLVSDFVCPSTYWVDTKEEKDKLLENYRTVLSSKECKYFKKGNGHCPFGNKCFYLHSTADGTKVDIGPPRRSNRRSRPRRFRSDFFDGIEVVQRLIMMGNVQDNDDSTDFSFDLSDVSTESDDDVFYLCEHLINL